MSVTVSRVTRYSIQCQKLVADKKTIKMIAIVIADCRPIAHLQDRLIRGAQSRIRRPFHK